MPSSIAKLITTLIVLLIAVTVVTTDAGLFVVLGNYRTLAEGQQAETTMHCAMRHSRSATRCDSTKVSCGSSGPIRRSRICATR
jgi:hypothetical protein